MKILIVDDDTGVYRNIIHYLPQYVSTKNDAYKQIQSNEYDIVFVNTKFNEDFVLRLREFNQYVPIYLVNLSMDGKGLHEYAPLIDGYLVNIKQIEKILIKESKKCKCLG